MAENVLVNDARVMSKGQVTIPKNIRAALGVSTGDRVTFIVENGTGFISEDDVANWITESRREECSE